MTWPAQPRSFAPRTQSGGVINTNTTKPTRILHPVCDRLGESRPSSGIIPAAETGRDVDPHGSVTDADSGEVAKLEKQAWKLARAIERAKDASFHGGRPIELMERLPGTGPSWLRAPASGLAAQSVAPKRARGTSGRPRELTSLADRAAQRPAAPRNSTGSCSAAGTVCGSGWAGRQRRVSKGLCLGFTGPQDRLSTQVYSHAGGSGIRFQTNPANDRRVVPRQPGKPHGIQPACSVTPSVCRGYPHSLSTGMSMNDRSCPYPAAHSTEVIPASARFSFAGSDGSQSSSGTVGWEGA